MTERRRWLVALVCGVVAVASHPRLRARDQKDIGSSESSITGRVIEADTQAPVADAEVRLGPPMPGPVVGGLPSAGTGWIGRLPSVLTGPDGRFAFVGVAAGSYSPHAQKAGYLPGSYGQSHPTGSGLRLDVLSGKTVDVTLQLWRQAVISGVVRTSRGQPLLGRKVTALRIFRTEPVGLFATALPVVSDDRGEYRIANLLPGRYLLCVVSEADPLSDRSGRPTSVSITPGACDAFAPNATLPTDATAIALAAGDERVADIDVPGSIGRVSVSGRVEGLPEVYPGTKARLVLANASPDIPAGFQVAVVPLAGDGSFVFPAVAPGAYFVRGLATPPRSSGASDGLDLIEGVYDRFHRPDARTPIRPLPSQRVMWFEQRIDVEQPLHDVMAHAMPGATVSGRVALDPQLTLSGADLKAIPVEAWPAPSGGWNLDGVPMGRVEADGTFASAALPPGRYSVVPSNQAGDWYAESVIAGGRDVRYEGLDVAGADIHDVVVTLATQHAVVSGQVRDVDGTPRPDASIFVFPAEERNWLFASPVEFRTDPSGAYTIPLPAGAWILAAAVGRLPEFCCDSDFLHGLAPRVTQISLARGERKTVGLTIQVISSR
jgi:hypothetical protein